MREFRLAVLGIVICGSIAGKLVVWLLTNQFDRVAIVEGTRLCSQT